MSLSELRTKVLRLNNEAVDELVKYTGDLEARVSCMEAEMHDHKMKAGEEGDIVRLVLEIPRATEPSKAIVIINNTLQLWLTKAPETFRKKV